MSNEIKQAEAEVASKPTGWVPDRFDGRDNYYVPWYRVDATKQSGINLRKHPTYGKFFGKGEFYKQDPYPTCVANAVSMAFAYEWRRQGLGDINPSRLFLFWNSRSIASAAGIQNQDPNNKEKKGGSYTRAAMKALAKVGVCQESDWPYSDKQYGNKPTDDAFKKALSNVSVGYFRIDPDNPEELEYRLRKDERETIGNLTLLRLRQCIAEGYPVVFGFNVYKKNEFLPIQFTSLKAEDPWTLPKLPSPLPPNRDDGKSDNYRVSGHAVLAIGYDDKTQQVLCQNSWGDVASTFYTPYEWIRDYEATADFWMIRIVAKDGNRGDQIQVDGQLPLSAPSD